MKKVMISLLCVLLTMCLLFAGCSSDKGDAVSDGDADKYSLSDAVIGDDLAQLKLFESGCFYLRGSMTDETGETLPMEVAMKDGNSYMASQMEGVTIAFMCVDTVYYMYYPDGECALALDDAVCSEMGLEPSDLAFDTAKLSIGDVDASNLISTEDAMVDGRAAECRTYQQQNGEIVKTYMDDGCLIRLQREDANGNSTMVLDIDVLADVFSDECVSIPSGTKLYSGTTGMMTFMLKFAAAVGMDNLS